MREFDSRSASRGRAIDRRSFLKVGGTGLGFMRLGGVVPYSATTPPRVDRAVILLMLVGGPSQLETWDPKPDSPEEIRGPFGSIATRIPGVRVGEHMPRIASRMDKLALIRSLHHDQAPIHETGLQLLQTGSVSREALPHFGSTFASMVGRPGGPPSFAIVPGPITETGVQLPRGQSAGNLGTGFEPTIIDPDRHAAGADPAIRRACDLQEEPASVRESYGPTLFGRRCLAARRLVEAGVRVVTVNMYQNVFDEVSWDCHGSAPFSSMDDYRREVLPTFDAAFSGLLDDLHSRGLLETTLVAAVGEFGRTPRINAAGGRDHWPGVWSALMAGGGVQGGRVVGASDDRASAPADRPVTTQEWLATIHMVLGMDTAAVDAPNGAAPIRELFS